MPAAADLQLRESCSNGDCPSRALKGVVAEHSLDWSARVTSAPSSTNLVDEAHLVDRMSDALVGEMKRRHELHRAAGRCANILCMQQKQVVITLFLGKNE